MYVYMSVSTARIQHIGRTEPYPKITELLETDDPPEGSTRPYGHPSRPKRSVKCSNGDGL